MRTKQKGLILDSDEIRDSIFGTSLILNFEKKIFLLCPPTRIFPAISP